MDITDAPDHISHISHISNTSDSLLPAGRINTLGMRAVYYTESPVMTVW